MIEWIKSLLCINKWQIVQEADGKYYVRKGDYYADKKGHARQKSSFWGPIIIVTYCSHDTIEEARKTLAYAEFGKNHKVIE